MDIDSVYRFVAAIMDQLRKDTALHMSCETVEPHPVNVCSHMFLQDINSFANEPKIDAVDIASEVLRLHTWQP